MKIAHIICTFPPYKGGMGNSVYHMARQIGARGHESVVFTPAYRGADAGEKSIGKNTKVVRLRPLIAIGNAAILPQLFLRLRHFDIIHLHYPFYGTADIVAWAKIIFRGKLVLHYHMDTVSHGLKGLIFKFYAFFFLPVVARLASRITCASLDYVAHSQLADFYINHKNNFIEVPFGVDAKRFYCGPEQRGPIVLFVGALDRQHYFKGVKELIEAFAITVKRHPEARLVLVGRGDLENYYKNLAVSQGLDKNFSIDSDASDEDLAAWYRQALVSVLPSTDKSEAFGLVLLEAMSSGTPVIASNLPGVRNVFHNKEHGFMIKPGKVELLAEKITYMLEHKDEAGRMGAAGRRWIEDRYSWDKVGERLEAAYLRILYTPKKQS